MHHAALTLPLPVRPGRQGRRCGFGAARERAGLSRRDPGRARILSPLRGPRAAVHLRAPLAFPRVFPARPEHPGAVGREGRGVPGGAGWAGSLVHPLGQGFGIQLL